ncbi:histone deacetylase [Pseudovirgaria hyperparasitica]|uniref:Histone deacetylase n=1 Tax=Pseudovirgaria hyperparasitica TaxID=470096 RepID=A0A6A6VYK5_9PEZI|nr:histone deacetylase [Pseudovirgaria hyperparasitica]KAF2755353.1 histone deacetylase [Pseudovirgaria hyperparasitica]
MAFRANDIVKEWVSQEEAAELPLQWTKLSDAEKNSIFDRTTEENGIERPKGHNVSFHYNARVEYHHFGRSHPMKPWRLTLTKQLILAYGLHNAMDLYESPQATLDDLNAFHGRPYLNFLKRIRVDTKEADENREDLETFGFGGEYNDCPVFDGLWDYVTIYTGATMEAARHLCNQTSDIAINWSGGLHHAKKNAASGFCYINDIVLAIHHMLKYHQRVLYIDIDVHHGDGVEQAFFSTPRVFTLSFHKFGDSFFPGTGDIHETGPTYRGNPGTAHALNIPIDDGIEDDQYKDLFEYVTAETIQRYQPTAIVLQCGADSLGGDRLGKFNLNIKSHGACVEFVKRYNLPLMILGGGGYTPRNVARTWCHETAVCVDATLSNELPEYVPYAKAFYGEGNGNNKLYPSLDNIEGKYHENKNDANVIRMLKERAVENLRLMEGCPSVSDNFKNLPMDVIEALIDRYNERKPALEKDYDEADGEQSEIGSETSRKRKERNIGGRSEHRFR